MLQLPDVAGPGVPFERAQRGLRQRDAPGSLGCGFLEEARRQRRHVLAPLAQRREPENEALQTEIEVLTEPALRDAALEIPVAGGDDPNVHRGGPCCPDPVEGLFLKDPEQLALVWSSQLADLVQEDRPAIRLLEVPLALGDRAREAPLRMAEQLALEQLGRNGGHVHRDERPAGARAQAVGRPCEQLLARSRLAEDEDRQGRARGLLQIPEARQHRGLAGDDGDLRTLSPQSLVGGIVELHVSGVGGA